MILPRTAQESLKSLGHEIRYARKRRRWTIKEFAAKMGVSSPTVMSLENGNPTVSIGIVFSAFWILGLEKELSSFSNPNDRIGMELLNRQLPKKINCLLNSYLKLHWS